MKTIIFIYALCIGLLQNCILEIDESKDYEDEILAVCLQKTYVSSSNFSYADEVQDINDGTFNIIEVQEQIYCFGLLRETKTYNLTIKKCLQGQVYRQEENDCKGTGSADDHYGAQKYQWCETNDTSCDDDETKSPAKASCLNDNTAGRSWKLLSVDTIYNVYEDLISINDGIPSGDSDYYWNPYSSNTSEAEASTLRGNTDTFSKDTYLYVLCVEKTGN